MLKFLLAIAAAISASASIPASADMSGRSARRAKSCEPRLDKSKSKSKSKSDEPIYEILSEKQQRARLTPELIRQALKALGKAGYSLKTNNREELKDPVAKKVIGRAIGFEMHPRTLLEAAVETFGSMLEALWTKEEVRASLQALSKAGYRPNASFFKYTKSTPELLAIVEGAVGFKTDLYSTYSQAQRLYKNDFKAALEDAGLKNLYHTKESQPWTKPLVCKALKSLYENGYLPKIYFLQNSKDEKALNIVIEAVGFKTTLNSLLNYAKELYDGDFRAALSDAEIPLDEIDQVAKRTPWTRELVDKALQALAREGFEPSASFLQRSKDPEALGILAETIGFEAPLSTLYNKAVEFYGSFQNALIGAGLPFQDIVGKYDKGNWSEAVIIKALQALWENGYAPRYLRYNDPNVAEIVTQAVGFPVEPFQVYKYALHFYDQDIEKALKAAGLPVEEIVSRLKHQKVDRGQIRAGLKALFMNQMFPSASLFLSGNRDVAKILRRELKIPISPRAFYEDIMEEYDGGMLSALRDANLPIYRFVQKWFASRIVMVMTTWLDREPPRKDGSLRKSYIIRCLRRLYEGGIVYNGPVAASESRSIVEVLSNMFGRQVSSRYLYDEATKAFGSYRQALLAANLPADEIILYRNKAIDPFALASTTLDTVWEKNRDGRIMERRRRVLGTLVTPEEQLLGKQVEEQFLKCLPIKLRADGAQILSIILSTDADDNQGLSDTVQRLALLEGIRPNRIEQIYEYVRTNLSFKKFLTGQFD